LKDVYLACPKKDRIAYFLWINRYLWKNDKGEKVAKELEIVVITKPKDKTWNQLIDEGLKAKEERETAYLRPPSHTPTLSGLHQALKKGAKLHAFRSGGGTRVVRLEIRDDLAGYGESITLEDALRRANDNYLKIKPRKSDKNYLTGQSLAASNVDAIALQGYSIDAWYDTLAELYYVQYLEFCHREVPEKVIAQAKSQPNVPVVFRDTASTRYLYVVTFVPGMFANGEDGTSTKCLTTSIDGGVPDDAYFYHAQKLGSGKNIWEAFQNAIASPSVEVKIIK